MNLKVERLETDRLILRKLRLSDLEDFIEYRRDENLYKYIASKPKLTREEYINDLKTKINFYRRKDSPLHWAVELKGEHKMIGAVGISNLHPTICSVFWETSAQYQQKGYAYEAMKRLLDYIFSATNIHRIEANVWEGNTASENLAKKLGFKPEGTLRDARFKDGKFFNVTVFGLLRDEYYAHS